jgi:hypothetical protein
MNAVTIETPRQRKPRVAKAALSPSQQFLASLLDLASNPDVSAEKLQVVAAAHQRVTAEEAAQAFNAAMTTAQNAMPAVVRDTVNDATMSKYARLETISDAIDPIIHAHGFALTFGTADSVLEEHYRVTCTVRHAAGHSETYFADVPADADAYEGDDKKIAVHAFGSSMTYGRRYLKCMIFDIVLKDEDNDGNPHSAAGPLITSQEVETLVSLMTAAGANRDRLLKVLRVESFSDLPQARFDEARALILAKRRA